jgi:hypothetical protein
MADKWAIHKGASKLAHSKGFAAGNKYAALGETLTLGLPGPFSREDQREYGYVQMALIRAESV